MYFYNDIYKIRLLFWRCRSQLIYELDSIIIHVFRYFGQITDDEGGQRCTPEAVCLRTNKTAMWNRCDEMSGRVDHGNTCSRAFGTDVSPVVSSLHSLPSVEQMIWLENNGFPLTTPLSGLVAAHRAVYQLTKPLRRVDALWRRAAMATSVAVTTAKLFENSSSVSTAAFSRLDRKLDDRK